MKLLLKSECVLKVSTFHDVVSQGPLGNGSEGIRIVESISTALLVLFFNCKPMIMINLLSERGLRRPKE